MHPKDSVQLAVAAAFALSLFGSAVEGIESSTHMSIEELLQCEVLEERGCFGEISLPPVATATYEPFYFPAQVEPADTRLTAGCFGSGPIVAANTGRPDVRCPSASAPGQQTLLLRSECEPADCLASCIFAQDCLPPGTYQLSLSEGEVLVDGEPNDCLTIPARCGPVEATILVQPT